MSKAVFFSQLRDRIRGLPHGEQQEIIRMYEDLFRHAEASGKNEREIIESLGFAPVPLPPGGPFYAEELKRGAESRIRVVVASVALGLFNLMFVLAPVLAATLLLFALSLTSVIFATSLIWIVIGTGVPTTLTVLLLELFAALAFTGLGVLMGIGLWKLIIGYGRLLKRYVKLNLRLIKGD